MVKNIDNRHATDKKNVTKKRIPSTLPNISKSNVFTEEKILWFSMIVCFVKMMAGGGRSFSNRLSEMSCVLSQGVVFPEPD